MGWTRCWRARQRRHQAWVAHTDSFQDDRGISGSGYYEVFVKKWRKSWPSKEVTTNIYSPVFSGNEEKAECGNCIYDHSDLLCGCDCPPQSLKRRPPLVAVPPAYLLWNGHPAPEINLWLRFFPSHHKGSCPLRKVQFFLTLFKRPLAPPPLSFEFFKWKF